MTGTPRSQLGRLCANKKALKEQGLRKSVIFSGLIALASATTTAVCSTDAATVGRDAVRMPYSEYVAKYCNNDRTCIDRYFSAAGRLSCPGFTASASIVGRPDVLVFAAESAMVSAGAGRCVRRPDFGKCFYQPIRADGSLGRRIVLLPRTLITSRDYTCEPDASDTRLYADWAIVKLRRPAPDVHPFRLLPTPDIDLMGLHVTTLQAQSADSKARRPREASICIGTVRAIWPSLSAPRKLAAIGTDCPSDPASAGGAILAHYGERDSAKYDKFVGIQNAHSTGPPPFGSAGLHGDPLLRGEFYDSLMTVLHR